MFFVTAILDTFVHDNCNKQNAILRFSFCVYPTVYGYTDTISYSWSRYGSMVFYYTEYNNKKIFNSFSFLLFYNITKVTVKNTNIIKG